MREDHSHIIHLARDQNVRFIRLWFVDILGFLKSFAIPITQLEESLERGVGFDGASLQGYARAEENDMVAMPDPTTFALLPWRAHDTGAVARMFCTIMEPSRAPCEIDPRWILRRVLSEAQEKGYHFYVSPEIEYFYLRNNKGKPELLDEAGYFDLTAYDAGSDLRRDTILLLEEMGIDVEFSHHEAAPSQHEIDLRYTDALTMADHVMTYRLVVKEVAQNYGLYATFMPKPLPGMNGSGMHVHQSLFEGERNVFADPRSEDGLSETARQYIAGLLRHAPEITLVTNQWVNSYKRLVPGYEAPTWTTWAFRNHANLIRVPTVQPERPEATRVEFRSPDAACNPYLAFAVMLAAGMEGIEKEYPLPPPSNNSPFPSAEEQEGVAALPSDLHAALDLAEKSDLLRRTLGETAFHRLLENKRLEWERFRAYVTDFELNEYLPLL